MTCDEAREAFSDLHDGRLSAGLLAALHRHLEACPACRAEWAAFRKTVQVVVELGSAEPSPGFAARVRRQVEAPPWGVRVVRWLFLPLRVKVPIQALALVLVAFAGLLIYQRSPELRRAAESPVAPPPPVARPAAPGARVPSPAGEISRKGGGTTPPADASKAERARGPAPPASAVAPPPAAPAESEQEGALTPLREEDKEAGRKTVPLEAPKAAEPPREFRAKQAEPGLPSRKLQPSPPAPAETPKPAEPPGQAGPRAPAMRDQLSAGPTGSADELYSGARADLDRQRYDRAIEGLRAFMARNPRDARVPDARLQVADALFAEQRYAEAIPEYEALIRQFPDSPLVPAALYRQARARLTLNDRAGCRLFQDVVDRYPQAPEAALAKDALSARCP